MHWIHLVKCQVVKFESLINVKFDITTLNDTIITRSILASITIHELILKNHFKLNFKSSMPLEKHMYRA